MSDEHNNDNLNDDNDFFRFSMDPENKKNGNNKNGGKRKRKFPIFTLLLFIFLGLLIVDLFQSKKQDNLIDFSDFKAKISSGEIVRVELGETYFTGYGPASAALFDQQLNTDQNAVPTGSLPFSAIHIFSFISGLLKALASSP